MRFVLILALLLSTPAVAAPQTRIHCTDPAGTTFADWREAREGYRLRLDGKWIAVPSSAVVPMLVLMVAEGMHCRVEKR